MQINSLPTKQRYPTLTSGYANSQDDASHTAFATPCAPIHGVTIPIFGNLQLGDSTHRAHHCDQFRTLLLVPGYERGTPHCRVVTTVLSVLSITRRLLLVYNVQLGLRLQVRARTSLPQSTQIAARSALRVRSTDKTVYITIASPSHHEYTLSKTISFQNLSRTPSEYHLNSIDRCIPSHVSCRLRPVSRHYHNA